MHRSSLERMKEFSKTLPESGLKVCDVGSRNVDDINIDPGFGTYKQYFKNHEYIGLDLVPGLNVDVIANGPYDYPFEDEYFDVVISGQVIEHTENIYAWVKEIARITKVGGRVCIIGPIDFEEHKHPIDCWRVFPDGMRFLLGRVAGLEVLSVDTKDKDCIAIGRKI